MKNNSILINEIRRLEQDNARLLELVGRLNDLLLKDDLTDAYGKRFIKEVDKRFKGAVTLAMGDIDNFKSINDVYGHVFGDEVIISVANIINEHIEPLDAAIRFGGDEFIIIFNNLSMEETAIKTDEIKQSITEEIKEMFNIPLTMSFGACEHIVGKVPFASSLTKADQRLYVAKLRGKNNVIANNLHAYKFNSGKGLKMVPKAISSN